MLNQGCKASWHIGPQGSVQITKSDYAQVHKDFDRKKSVDARHVM
jgi:hypothetical protein